MAVIAVMTIGASVLACLSAWAIIPQEGEKTSLAENLLGDNQGASAH